MEQVLAVLLVVAFVGGIYFYSQKKKANRASGNSGNGQGGSGGSDFEITPDPDQEK